MCVSVRPFLRVFYFHSIEFTRDYFAICFIFIILCYQVNSYDLLPRFSRIVLLVLGKLDIYDFHCASDITLSEGCRIDQYQVLIRHHQARNVCTIPCIYSNDIETDSIPRPISNKHIIDFIPPLFLLYCGMVNSLIAMTIEVIWYP